MTPLIEGGSPVATTSSLPRGTIQTANDLVNNTIAEEESDDQESRSGTTREHELEVVRHPLVYMDVVDHGECTMLLGRDFAALRNKTRNLSYYCKRCVYKTLFNFYGLRMEDRVQLWLQILQID